MDEQTEENKDMEMEEVLKEQENEQIDALQKSKEEAEDFKKKYFMALAELENTRKRLQKEKQEMMKFAVENVLCDFLAPLDSIETAMGFTDQMSDETRNWVNGFKMLISQIKDVITQHGVVSYHSKGQIFDPHMHEAIEVEESIEIEDGVILEEFVKGYKIGDRILRPAKVKVAKKIIETKEGE